MQYQPDEGAANVEITLTDAIGDANLLTTAVDPIPASQVCSVPPVVPPVVFWFRTSE